MDDGRSALSRRTSCCCNMSTCRCKHARGMCFFLSLVRKTGRSWMAYTSTQAMSRAHRRKRGKHSSPLINWYLTRLCRNTLITTVYIRLLEIENLHLVSCTRSMLLWEVLPLTYQPAVRLAQVLHLPRHAKMSLTSKAFSTS